MHASEAVDSSGGGLVDGVKTKTGTQAENGAATGGNPDEWVMVDKDELDGAGEENGEASRTSVGTKDFGSGVVLESFAPKTRVLGRIDFRLRVVARSASPNPIALVSASSLAALDVPASVSRFSFPPSFKTGAQRAQREDEIRKRSSG